MNDRICGLNTWPGTSTGKPGGYGVTYVVDKEGKIAFVEVGNTAIDPTAADTACSRLAHKAAVQGK